MASTDLFTIQETFNAENAVIGSLLIDPEIAEALFAAVRAEDFLYDANRVIFTIARDLFLRGSPVDAVTIAGKLPPVSDNRKRMADLIEITPTSANWKAYADIMRQKSNLVRVHDAAEAMTKANDFDECRALLHSIESLLDGRTVHKPRSMRDSFLSFCKRQELPPPEYIRYGIPELDRMMFTERGDVVVIGGLPSSGKTALALAFAWHIGQSHKTAFFSLETKNAKLDDRMISRNALLSFSRIKTRSLSSDDWDNIAKVSGSYDKNQLYTFTTEENGPLTLADIQSLTRAYQFEVIFIDYVQEIPALYSRANLREQITAISLSLHSFAQSSGVTVFELAQLSRPSKDGWKEPDMFDLKESGQLEQDADAVLLLYRPKKGHARLDEKKNRFLKVAKNKEGVTGTLLLDFDGETQSFRVASHTSEIARALSDAGRAAKSRSRQTDEYPQTQLLPDDDYEYPF